MNKPIANLSFSEREEIFREFYGTHFIWVWEYRFADARLITSNHIRELLPEVPDDYLHFMHNIRQEDRFRAGFAILKAVRLKRGFIVECTTRLQAGYPASRIQIHGQIIRDSEGRTVCLRGSVKNISELRIASNIGKDDSFRSLFELSAVGVVYGDRVGNMIRANKKYCTMVGLNIEELIGRTIFDFTHPEDRALTRTEQAALFQNLKHESSFEKRYVSVQGRVFWVRVTVSTIRNLHGEIEYFVAIVEDIDQQKKIEQEINEARRSAISASEAKSAFLANMSHEIRTPLGVMLGYCELLKRKSHDERERDEFLHAIMRNGHELSLLINDLLDLSKIEADKLELAWDRIELSQLMHSVIESMRVKANEKGISLELNMDATVPQRIVSDATRLRQILLNVVGNAIKFTNHGAVHVGLSSVRASPEAAGVLTFTIQDTGCGMDKQHIDRLFQPFSQIDSTTTRRFGGTGLGLMLSRKLAKALGGDVFLKETELGVGSTFVVSIDPGPSFDSFGQGMSSTETKGLAQKASEQNRLRGLRILLAEDALDNQFIFSSVLRAEGAEVEVVDNGQAAIDRGLEQSFDLILMDIQMPILDGYNAARQLRSKGFINPILALTAHAMAEDRRKCRLAGCNDHLAKPVNLELLVTTILTFCRSFN